KIFIKEKFRSLINSSTRFYRQSGVRFELDRDHMRLTTGAMDTVLQGGLAFVVNDKKAAKVAKNYTFKLYENELLANAENTFVSVMMDRGFKLKSGSQVLYKDLKVGYVESLHFYGDHKVKARVAIDKKHASLLVKDTLFWVEDLEATVRGIKNAPAAIFGPSLVLQPGKSSVSGKNYILSEKKPFRIYTREGLRIMVKGNRKSSIKPGAPLLYRQLKVGFVEHYDLAKDGTTVNVGLFIEKKYAHMVRKNTRFYLLSAIGMKIGLTGIKVMTETLDSMIYGGIGMATSEEGLGAKAQEGDSFLLELEADDDWYEWAPKLSS
ncbi:MAG: MlaD family protein, partial [Thiovulaceae bacterium]|nr:MlaD family protein [Sulfurimonadaceae bacterium]